MYEPDEYYKLLENYCHELPKNTASDHGHETSTGGFRRGEYNVICAYHSKFRRYYRRKTMVARSVELALNKEF